MDVQFEHLAKQLQASAGRVQFLEGWIEKMQDNQARSGGKTALSEISFVILSFGTKTHFSIDMIKGSKAPGQPLNANLIHNALTIGLMSPLPRDRCFQGRTSRVPVWSPGNIVLKKTRARQM